MKTIKLDIGGDLLPGDVVGIAYNNCIDYGWFVESGLYGSLKYIPLRVPIYIKNQFDSINTVPPLQNVNWLKKKYVNGLLFKHFSKTFIIKLSHNRVFKVQDPTTFFIDSLLEPVYLNGKQILTDNNFPAK